MVISVNYSLFSKIIHQNRTKYHQNYGKFSNKSTFFLTRQNPTHNSLKESFVDLYLN